MWQIVYQRDWRTEISDSQDDKANEQKGDKGREGENPRYCPPHLRSGYLPTLSSRIYSCILTNNHFLFGLLELLSVTCNQEGEFIL